jgi:hypothetical protein
MMEEQFGTALPKSCPHAARLIDTEDFTLFLVWHDKSF